ncbi:MAG: type II toxin-antitoxin system VapC family toxin [Nakamurella sp.]
MIVVDASVLINAITDDGPVGTAGRAELGRDPHWAAPEHLVVEVFSAIRGRWLCRRVSEQRAIDALAAMAAATVDLVASTPLLDRMWELRHNVKGYAAAYLAVAETFGCALVMADARLPQVPGLRCEVRLALPTDEECRRWPPSVIVIRVQNGPAAPRWSHGANRHSHQKPQC